MLGLLDTRVNGVADKVKDIESRSETTAFRDTTSILQVARVALAKLDILLVLSQLAKSKNLVLAGHVCQLRHRQIVFAFAVLSSKSVFVASHHSLSLELLDRAVDFGVEVKFPDSKQGSDEEKHDAFLEGASDPSCVVLDLAGSVADAGGQHDEGPHQE